MEARPSSLHIIQTCLSPPPPTDSDTPQTIKMEDLAPASPAPSALHEIPADTPKSDSKPVKKRKSWGQVLPEPKTSLPPRKRAKTADEKEQRRIERVKRNRLAAHNSRERKRQEVEALQERNDILEQQIRALQAKVEAAGIRQPHANCVIDLANRPSCPIPRSPEPSFLLESRQLVVNHGLARGHSTIDPPDSDARSFRPDTTICSIVVVVRPAVSVGSFFVNLDGSVSKPIKTHFDQTLEFQDLQNDDMDNGFFDFALFPEEDKSFFNEGFDGNSALQSRSDGLSGEQTSETTESLGESFFDLQPAVASAPDF